MTGFIGVHVGAGYHSEKYREQYSNICKRACLKGVEVLRGGGDCIEGACAATSVLEDAELTNAGRGSNLTWDGHVECDASIMNSLGNYGAVAAVSGMQNPVRLAREICMARTRPLSLERVPPCLLVGEGALKWARNHSIATVDPTTMVTERARRQHIKYKTRSQAEPNHQKAGEEERLDTVGAVCVDMEGRLSAASSSGGVLLKAPGRVGQAAQYAAGVWAQQASYPNEEGEGSSNRSGVAVATSGTGEQLITTLLARTVALPLLTSSSPAVDLHNAIKKQFIGSPFLRGEKKKLCGVLVVKTEEDGDRGELLWSHTTQTMALGYMSTSMKRPKSMLSSLEEDKCASEVVVGGIMW